MLKGFEFLSLSDLDFLSRGSSVCTLGYMSMWHPVCFSVLVIGTQPVNKHLYHTVLRLLVWGQGLTISRSGDDWLLFADCSPTHEGRAS